MNRPPRLIQGILLGAFLLYAVIPIYLVLLASLRDRSALFGNPLHFPWPPVVQNYVNLWIRGRFALCFLNSLKIAVPSTVIVVIFASLAGYAFAKMRFPGKEVAFALLLFGMVIPVPAIIVALYGNLLAMGLMDTHLGVILSQAAIFMPFAVFMMRTFFEEVPDELIAAARIDGASSGAVLRYVVLPLSMPGLRSLALIEFMFAWQEYLLPLVTLQADSLKPLTVGMSTLFGRYGVNYSGIAAGSVITFAPVLLLYLALHRSFTQGLTMGAWK